MDASYARHHRQIIRTLGIVSLILVVVVVYPVVSRAVKHSRINRIVSSASASVFRTNGDNDLKKAQTAIQATITAHPETTIGVSLINTQTGSQFNAGSTTAFSGASTTKIITAAAYLHQVEAGKHDLDDPMGAYTSGFELQQMVQQSNNDAWGLLVDELGLSQLQAYARSIGLSTYKVSDNSLTAADDALLLNQLYNGKLLSPAHTQLLLSYMQDTNYEELIPSALPNGVTVHHKYGLLDGNLHDTAIISSGKTAFVLAIYTTQGEQATSASTANQTTIIQEITRKAVANIVTKGD